MLKKTITCEDYAGNTYTQDFWFNLNRAELTEMELSYEGGMIERMKAIINTAEATKVFPMIKDIVLRSYGVKSENNRRFIKSDELRDAFEQTDAYNQLICEFFDNPDSFNNFLLGVIPKADSNATVKTTAD